MPQAVGGLGEIDGLRALQITNAYTLAFFDRYLRDRPSPLLAGPSPDHPEVEFESRNSEPTPLEAWSCASLDAPVSAVPGGL